MIEYSEKSIDRFANGSVAMATVIIHKNDGNTMIHHGDLMWAMDYAATYFSRGEAIRNSTRLTEVAFKGDIVATFKQREV